MNLILDCVIKNIKKSNLNNIEKQIFLKEAKTLKKEYNSIKIYNNYNCTIFNTTYLTMFNRNIELHFDYLKICNNYENIKSADKKFMSFLELFKILKDDYTQSIEEFNRIDKLVKKQFLHDIEPIIICNFNFQCFDNRYIMLDGRHRYTEYKKGLLKEPIPVIIIEDIKDLKEYNASKSSSILFNTILLIDKINFAIRNNT